VFLLPQGAALAALASKVAVEQGIVIFCKNFSSSE